MQEVSVISSQIKQIMAVLNMQQKDMAVALNVPLNRIKSLTSGRVSKFSPAEIMTLVDKLGVNSTWLATGKGEIFERKDKKTNPKIESNASFSRLRVTVYDDPSELDPELFVVVPYYRDVKLSAGNGSCVFEDVEKYDMPFMRYFFKTRNVDYKNAVMVKVRGRSMEPMYQDGGVVLVDMSDREVRDGDVYAIRQNDLLRIKQLSYRMADGALVVTSMNPEFPPEIIVGEQMNQIEVIGRVRWNANG